MSDDAFLDTNILIYATQSADPRAAVAVGLLAQGGVISVQVLNEFASVAHRKLRRPWAEIRSTLADIRAVCRSVRPISLQTHGAAVELAEREGFGFYDALIVASALEFGCRILWSEDMQDGRVIDGALTIRNPFGGRLDVPGQARVGRTAPGGG